MASAALLELTQTESRRETAGKAASCEKQESLPCDLRRGHSVGRSNSISVSRWTQQAGSSACGNWKRRSVLVAVPICLALGCVLLNLSRKEVSGLEGIQDQSESAGGRTRLSGRFGFGKNKAKTPKKADSSAIPVAGNTTRTFRLKADPSAIPTPGDVTVILRPPRGEKFVKHRNAPAVPQAHRDVGGMRQSLFLGLFEDEVVAESESEDQGDEKEAADDSQVVAPSSDAYQQPVDQIEGEIPEPDSSEEESLYADPFGEKAWMQDFRSSTTEVFEAHMSRVPTKGILQPDEEIEVNPLLTQDAVTSFIKGSMESPKSAKNVRKAEEEVEFNRVTEGTLMTSVGSYENVEGYLDRREEDTSENTLFFFISKADAYLKTENFKLLLAETRSPSIDESALKSAYRIAAHPLQWLGGWTASTSQPQIGRFAGVDVVLGKGPGGETLTPHKDIWAMRNRDQDVYRKFIVASMFWWKSYSDRKIGIGELVLGDVLDLFTVKILSEDLVDEYLIAEIIEKAAARKERGAEHRTPRILLELGEGSPLPPEKVMKRVMTFCTRLQELNIKMVFADARPSSMLLPSSPSKGGSSHGTTLQRQPPSENFFKIVQIPGVFQLFKFSPEVVWDLVCDDPDFAPEAHAALVNKLLVGPAAEQHNMLLQRMSHKSEQSQTMDAVTVYTEVYQTIQLLSNAGVATVFPAPLLAAFLPLEVGHLFGHLFGRKRTEATEEVGHLFAGGRRLAAEKPRLGHRFFFFALLAMEDMGRRGFKPFEVNTWAPEFRRRMSVLTNKNGPDLKARLVQVFGAPCFLDALTNTKLKMLVSGLREEDAWNFPPNAISEIAIDVFKSPAKYVKPAAVSGFEPLLHIAAVV